MDDRIRVTIDFKLSKNYNSIGGSMSYESSQKPDEDVDQLNDRVYNYVNDKVEKIFDQCQITLLNITGK